MHMENERKENTTQDKVNGLKFGFECLGDGYFHLDLCDDVWFKYYFELQSLGTQEPISLAELFSEQDVQPQTNTISSLNKRIKYCKNPMEKRDLEQQLNKLYKERKKKYD